MFIKTLTNSFRSLCCPRAVRAPSLACPGADPEQVSLARLQIFEGDVLQRGGNLVRLIQWRFPIVVGP